MRTSLIEDDEEEPPVSDHSLKMYAGFKEHAYKLLFNYEDKYPDRSPEVPTILDTGIIENTKVCRPEKEKGLITFSFAQTMPKKAAMQHKESKCVWQRDNGSWALVQTWSTKYNGQFKRDFTITKTNPDVSKFEPQAVDEFHQAMKNFFGDAAQNHEILYCHKTANNPHNVYIGQSNFLIYLLRNKVGLKDELDIESVWDDGFVARVKNAEGEAKKEFALSPYTRYALYTKVGYDTMACATPLDIFMRHNELNDEVDIGFKVDLKDVEKKMLPVFFVNPEVQKLDHKIKHEEIAEGTDSKHPTMSAFS